MTSNQQKQRLGIMSAMAEEVESLLYELSNQTSEVHGKRTYYKGQLFGKLDVVIVFSRWGKVAAAATTAILIERYNCEEIIFTGVAGGVLHGLNVGDIVIANRLVQHDMNATPIFKRFEIPLLGVTEFSTSDYRREQLIQAASAFVLRDAGLKKMTTKEQREKFHIANPKVITGLTASGDKFFASKEDLDQLRKDLPECTCVEMEGAAVAQVCQEHDIPFSIVRVISDSADDSADIDFQEFVKEIATVYSHGILELALATST
jgi:adenosylhomocysteine nucleosidase